MIRLIAVAVLAASLAGCGAAPTLAPAAEAPVTLEAQAAAKTAIKKAAVEAVEAEMAKLKIKPTSVKATKVELEGTAKDDARNFVATVDVKSTTPFGIEERTYEVSGTSQPDNKKKPVVVKEVDLTRQTR
jgi:hypothetical protein